jgi:hypothetical protein
VSQRRNARPAKQPYVACGRYTPTKRDWQVEYLGGATPPVTVELDNSDLQFPPVRIFTKVDTTSGGFQAIPEYTVRLIGDRPRQGTAVPINYYMLDGLIDVASTPAPTPRSFWVDIFPFFWTVVIGTADSVTADATLFQGWQIGWMGVES